jgi:hypothetical protein
MARARSDRPKQYRPSREPSAEAALEREIDAILARLEVGIAEERKAMAELLERLRTTRIAVAA